MSNETFTEAEITEVGQLPEMVWATSELESLKGKERGIDIPFIKVWNGERGVGIALATNVKWTLELLGDVIRQFAKPKNPDIIIVGVTLTIEDRDCDMFHVEMYEGNGKITLLCFHDGDVNYVQGEFCPLGRLLFPPATPIGLN
jgi:hypothetical protein